MIFYAWGGFTAFIIMVASIVLNHFIGRGITSTKSAKTWLTVGVVVNVGVLAVFKYSGFVVNNINLLFGALSLDALIPDPKIRLPLGISFFTFQQISMLWDLYRDEQKPRIRFTETALYVSLFPQLVAGPIVRFHDVLGQIKQRTVSIEMFHSGVQRFIIGLFKKVALANTLGQLADDVIRVDSNLLSAPAAWLGIGAYALQIFFDFSGYSDMAIGLGRMFGFSFLENFNYPYISTSIKEFWRRWHISLSTWFRDYVYIPLGGNQQGGWKTYRNLFIVFLLTGLWHGASWSFVVWGLFHGCFLIVERLGWGKVFDRWPRPIGWAYCTVVVLVGWVFFRIDELPDALRYIATMSGIYGQQLVSYRVFLNNLNIVVLVVSVLMATPWPQQWLVRIFPSAQSETPVHMMLELVRTSGLMAMFFYCVMLLAGGTFNPFIYFRF